MWHKSPGDAVKEDSLVVQSRADTVFLRSTRVAHAADPGPHSEKQGLRTHSHLPQPTLSPKQSAVRPFKSLFVGWLIIGQTPVTLRKEQKQQRWESL